MLPSGTLSFPAGVMLMTYVQLDHSTTAAVLIIPTAVASTYQQNRQQKASTLVDVSALQQPGTSTRGKTIAAFIFSRMKTMITRIGV